MYRAESSALIGVTTGEPAFRCRYAGRDDDANRAARPAAFRSGRVTEHQFWRRGVDGRGEPAIVVPGDPELLPGRRPAAVVDGGAHGGHANSWHRPDQSLVCPYAATSDKAAATGRAA